MISDEEIIGIDFVAGSHGNFLEFVCNKYIAKIDCNFSPFGNHGTSHAKPMSYVTSRKFCANHYSVYGLPVPRKVVRITFSDNDLLLLHSASLLKAADVWLITNKLEVDTYHKLNNRHYRDLLEQLTANYPDIGLSSKNPDCPRYVLREFFKFGFLSPASHGLVKHRNLMLYNNEHTVFDFNFSCFYNKEMFLHGISELANWYGVAVDPSGVNPLYNEFISRQKFKEHKLQVDNILSAIQSAQVVDIPKLDLLQESYINGQIERIYNIEMPFIQEEYFTNTKDILEYIHSNV